MPPTEVEKNRPPYRYRIEDGAKCQRRFSGPNPRLWRPEAARGRRQRRPQGAVHAFFASIPYQWDANNDIADYEGFYASVLYSYFAALGYDVTLEECSSHGRLDMAVRAAGRVYLFEFKVAEMAPPGPALAQLQERRYADK